MQEFLSEINSKIKDSEPSTSEGQQEATQAESATPGESAQTSTGEPKPAEESLEATLERELIAESRRESSELVFRAGKSRRVYNELFKVIDASDVVIQVLDARDPLGTRSRYVEEYIRKEKAHKHVVLLLNKIDLVPTAVTVRYVLPLLCAAFSKVARTTW